MNSRSCKNINSKSYLYQSKIIYKKILISENFFIYYNQFQLVLIQNLILTLAELVIEPSFSEISNTSIEPVLVFGFLKIALMVYFQNLDEFIESIFQIH